METKKLKRKSNIGRKIYEKDGFNIGEAIYRPEEKPWWGVNLSVLERLKADNRPFNYNFIHKGHGGISCQEGDLDRLLMIASKDRNGNFKINFRDFKKANIDAKWDANLKSEFET